MPCFGVKIKSLFSRPIDTHTQLFFIMNYQLLVKVTFHLHTYTCTQTRQLQETGNYRKLQATTNCINTLVIKSKALFTETDEILNSGILTYLNTFVVRGNLYFQVTLHISLCALQRLLSSF